MSLSLSLVSMVGNGITYVYINTVLWVLSFLCFFVVVGGGFFFF